MLEIKDLHVSVEGKEIIKGVSLQFEKGKVYTIMGPNGSGKSTLANTLMGNPKYKVTSGTIWLDGRDITTEKVDNRSKIGLFLSFQYPKEISGLSISNFLRTAVNARREKKYSVVEFHKLLKEKMALLGMEKSFSRRSLNEGFSGGEKKRAEMLQMLMLEPKYAMLDETDSGLDVDAIKTVAESINLARKQQDMAIIVITHYNRFLEYLQPDEVMVLNEGKIVQSGGYEVAKQIEATGFKEILEVGNGQ
jgi:Fe-S cluster assembly ATP-binding protein